MLKLIKRETALYWLIYLLLVALSASAIMEGVLMVQNTTIILFGLLWLWTGVAALVGLNPPLLRLPTLRTLRLCALLCVALGAVWIGMSLTALSNQALPMVAVSAPFAVALIVLMMRDKGSEEDTAEQEKK